MELKVEKDIRRVCRQQWQSLAGGQDFFNEYDFLLALQEAKVENSEMMFLTFTENEIPVASAVLSSFNINLDLFAGDSKAVCFLKNTFPGFFKVKILFCGTPLSAGQKNFIVKEKKYIKEVLQLCTEFMEDYSKRNNIGFQVFKEMDGGQIKDFDLLNSFGFFRAHSLPNVNLALNFKNYREYFDNLRHSYRRQIRIALNKINTDLPVFVQDYFEKPFEEKHPVFTVLDAKEFDSNEFYPLYKKVMGRAQVKLEELNREFFYQLFQQYPERIKILALVFKGKVLGTFVLVQSGIKIIFLWTGKEDEKDAYDTYSNLMNAMVYWAIEKGFSELVMGQTSYYPKQRLGGMVQPLFFYFRARSKWKNLLLKTFNQQIFPPLEIKHLKVFKE